MTVPSNLNSTRFSPLAPTQAAQKPAASATSTGTARTKESATTAQPSLPGGLVGHHVNTTA
ncbi:MAG TPA: hypothetical protein VEN30_09740 [Paraburkholderia sp.]|nr:hypothetical protein [Paraburkholderia sp.]